MALSCKQGSFTKTTAGAPTTQQITIGFQAKAIFFWCNSDTAESFADGHKMSLGFCDSSAVNTGSACIGITSDDNQTSSVTDRTEGVASCIKIITGGSTVEVEAYVSAIDSTSYTLSYTTNNASALLVGYFAIGGSDITNTKVGLFTAPTVTGVQSTTGIGFQPDFVFTLSRKDTATAAQNNACILISMNCSPTQRGTIAITTEDGRNPSDTWRKQRTDKALTIIQPSTGAQMGEADTMTMASDGWDLDWSTANDNATRLLYLAIKGGSPMIGNFLQPTSNGVQTYSTTSGKTPKGVMMLSANQINSTSINSESRLTVGGTDGTSECTMWQGDTDNVTPTTNAHKFSTAKAIILATEAATGSSSTTNAEADTDSFNDGNFKLNWTTTDATQREVIFFAFSETTAAGATDMTQVAAKTYSNKFITKV